MTQRASERVKAFPYIPNQVVHLSCLAHQLRLDSSLPKGEGHYDC